MKESSRSLRMFLLILAIFSAYSVFFAFQTGTYATSAMQIVNVAIGAVFALAYLYLAIKLPRYLTPTASPKLKMFIIGSLVLFELLDLAAYILGTDPEITIGYIIFSLVVTILWGWYLISNINRLSKPR